MRLILLILLWLSPLCAVTLDKEQLYVVYTYNFIQHVSWDAPEKTRAYRILVLSDNPVLQEDFRQLARKREVHGHPIRVSFDAQLPPEQFNVVFVDVNLHSAMARLLPRIDGSQTLLVTVDYSDPQQVMINLIPRENAQYTFEIHRANILNQGLTISDQLILLGGTEIDVAALYKQTRESLENEARYARELAEKIAAKTAELETTKEKIAFQQSMIKKQTETIEAQDAQMTLAREELEAIAAEVWQRTREVQRQQQLLDDLSDARQVTDEEIAVQSAVLQKLKERIYANQDALLTQKQTISDQRNIITVLVFFLAVIAILIFFLLKLLRENRNHAQRDFLTGLYNRRHFMRLAHNYVERHHLGPSPLNLAMIDIDHFKPINDTYGHDTGDQALRIVATMLRERIKPYGITARWGGEEFIVLMELPADKALELITEFKEQLPQRKIHVDDHAPFSMTISVGLYSGDGDESLESMITAADALLYKAKKEGRNRIETAL